MVDGLGRFEFISLGTEVQTLPGSQSVTPRSRAAKRQQASREEENQAGGLRDDVETHVAQHALLHGRERADPLALGR